MSQKPDLPWHGDIPPRPSEAEPPILKPEEQPKERSVFGLAAELKNQIRDDRVTRSEKERSANGPVTDSKQASNRDQKGNKKDNKIMKFLKTFSAFAMLCLLSWNGEAVAQGLPRASNDILNMKVSVSCKNGDATFTITNKGAAWPGVGNFSVFSTAATVLMRQRRMRLGEGQRITFRVLGVAGDSPELGLWVNPSWFKRRFDYDAKITCG